METQSSLINFTHTYELIQRYAMDIRKRYQDKLVLHDHIATGKLFNSARYEITSGNNVVEVSLNLEDVWKWVENDTKPHFPPLSAILAWVKAKPVIPSQTYNGKLPTQEQLAFLIARKISEEGTEGTHDLEQARMDADADFNALLDEALTLDIDECLDTLLALT